jgi:hypothetical protein
MKTKKFVQWFFGILGITSAISLIAIILSLIIDLYFFDGANQICGFIRTIGVLAFMMPFLVLQFTMTAGLMDRFDGQTNIPFSNTPFWGKVMFYLIVFPFADMLVISALDDLFHFLPNYQEAMAQGYDRVVVRAMFQQWQSQALIIIGITYTSIIGIGLLFKVVFINKLKTKIA